GCNGAGAIPPATLVEITVASNSGQVGCNGAGAIPPAMT
ncbi:hypothetical protein A2U01_0110416, partial [Trifolium medium]|nr:hypothetical protein [Trifolium medium]